jgi:hypothetical protein
MNSSFPLHRYQPLVPASQTHGEMRVLTLLPGSNGSPIVCKLHHVPIHSPPPYEALSYTWGTTKGQFSKIPAIGDPEQTHTIVLDRLYKTIGNSLYVALQHLRDGLEPRSLWVDALCIDQENDAEKSKQVAAMVDIYRQSSTTLVWLGELDEIVDLAFDTLEELCWAAKLLIFHYCTKKLDVSLQEVSSALVQKMIESELASPESSVTSPFQELCYPKAMDSFQRAMDLVDPRYYAQKAASLADIAAATWGKSRSFAEAVVSNQIHLSQLPDFEERMQALEDVFMRRSYWDRLWVVQELLLSSDAVLICGERSADLDLMALVHCITDASDPSTGSSTLVPSADFDFVEELKSAMSVTTDFHTAIVRAQTARLAQNCQLYANKLCSDPRDAIFALLNISQPINFIPDYSKSPEDVYIGAARAMIDQERNLNIICTEVMEDLSKILGCPPSMDLPSWVPHFESFLWPSFLHQYMWAYENQIFRGGGILPVKKTAPNVLHTRILQINGCFYGTIESVQPRFRPFSMPINSELWSAVNKLHSIVSNAKTISSSAHPEIQSWYVLLMDQYPEVGNTKQQRPSQHSGPHETLVTDLETALNSEPPTRLCHELRSKLSQKALCTTSTGHVALVLGNARVGDGIFVARGATNPFVLRPAVADETYDAVQKASGESTLYNFIGGSYVHGIMDGEVLEMIDEVGTGVREETVFLI